MCLGIPGKVAETYLQNDLPMAKVEFGGIRKEICLAYVPEAVVGDYVIVHVGFAISRVDEKEAEEIFSYLKQIGEAGRARNLHEIPRRISKRRRRQAVGGGHRPGDDPAVEHHGSLRGANPRHPPLRAG